MELSIDSNSTPQRIVARLRDAQAETTVSGWSATQAAAALIDALDAARRDGYGDCMWLEPDGQYWWMFHSVRGELDLVVLWSSGTIPGWQHVFRGADSIESFAQRVRDEFTHHGLVQEF
jgi:hypothetical protein